MSKNNKNDGNKSGRAPTSWNVETRSLEEMGRNIVQGQVELIVRTDESYSFICGCGSTYDGDLKKEDVVNGWANCPRGDTSVPLMAVARGGPMVYRFIPVQLGA